MAQGKLYKRANKQQKKKRRNINKRAFGMTKQSRIFFFFEFVGWLKDTFFGEKETFVDDTPPWSLIDYAFSINV